MTSWYVGNSVTWLPAACYTMNLTPTTPIPAMINFETDS